MRPPSALEQALAEALAAPAPAATTFGELGLSAPLVGALARQGIEAPFAIQARALPDALAGRDVLGRAQTGSGKTLAFGLPMLTRLAGLPDPRRALSPQGLVLVPTRELAKQVSDVLFPLARALGLTVTTVYGGASIGKQIDRLRDGVDIVVATPGRLIDLLDRGSCRLDRVEVSVLDEADHMSDLGFYPAVTRILRETPEGGQRLLFSATLDRDVERLVTEFLDGPAIHAVAAAVDVASAADHQVFVLPAADKVAIAAEIAGRPARTLFFVRTKHGADRLAKQLTNAGTPAGAIHGNLNQGQRQRALDAFAAGHPRVLVATDVAARGLHIDDVGLVVHFDPPADHKDYLHRSGRTARAGATGTVLAFVDPAQLGDVAKIHDAAGVTPTRHEVGPGHDAVREIATSGEPVPPPPPPRPARAAAGDRPSRPARRRAPGGAGRAASDEARGEWTPRRPRTEEAGRFARGSDAGEQGRYARAAEPNEGGRFARGANPNEGGRFARGAGADERGGYSARRPVGEDSRGAGSPRRGAGDGARSGRPSWGGTRDGANATRPGRAASVGAAGLRRPVSGGKAVGGRPAPGKAHSRRPTRGDF